MPTAKVPLSPHWRYFYQPMRTPRDLASPGFHNRTWKGRENAFLSEPLLGPVGVRLGGQSGAPPGGWLLACDSVGCLDSVSAQRGWGSVLLGHLEKPSGLRHKVKKGPALQNRTCLANNRAHSLCPRAQHRVKGGRQRAGQNGLQMLVLFHRISLQGKTGQERGRYWQSWEVFDRVENPGVGQPQMQSEPWASRRPMQRVGVAPLSF